jgi:hypothetical protein
MNARDKIRDEFGHDNIDIAHTRREIRVYYLRDPRGVEWVPAGGGPLYRQQAIESADWLANHLEEFRELLPKSVRDFAIVFGELDCRTYPGTFRATRVPATT